MYKNVRYIYFHVFFASVQQKNLFHPLKNTFSPSFFLRQPVKRLCNWPCRVASWAVMRPQQLRRMACPAASCGPRTIRWTMCQSRSTPQWRIFENMPKFGGLKAFWGKIHVYIYIRIYIYILYIYIFYIYQKTSTGLLYIFCWKETRAADLQSFFNVFWFLCFCHGGSVSIGDPVWLVFIRSIHLMGKLPKSLKSKTSRKNEEGLIDMFLHFCV